MASRTQDFIDNGLTWRGIDHDDQPDTAFFENAKGQIERWSKHTERPLTGNRIMQSATRWYVYLETMPDTFTLDTGPNATQVAAWSDEAGKWWWSTGDVDVGPFETARVAARNCYLTHGAMGVPVFVHYAGPKPKPGRKAKPQVVVFVTSDISAGKLVHYWTTGPGRNGPFSSFKKARNDARAAIKPLGLTAVFTSVGISA